MFLSEETLSSVYKTESFEYAIVSSYIAKRIGRQDRVNVYNYSLPKIRDKFPRKLILKEFMEFLHKNHSLKINLHSHDSESPSYSQSYLIGEIDLVEGTKVMIYLSVSDAFGLLKFFSTEEFFESPELAKICRKIDDIVLSFAGDIFDNEVDIKCWYKGDSGYTFNNKRIKVPEWSKISQNYPSVEKELSKLHSIKNPYSYGKIVILRSEPGTGKTWAIRSLLSSWRDMEINLITDADSFFCSGSAIQEVLASPDYDGTSEVAKPKLIVLEDASDFIHEKAQQIYASARSKLLNLSDGILGDGCELILLISTNLENEDIDKATARPGRCLANLEFKRFTVQQANQWLACNGYNNKVDEPKTLAELYNLISPVNIITEEKENNRMGFSK